MNIKPNTLLIDNFGLGVFNDFINRQSNFTVVFEEYKEKIQVKRDTLKLIAQMSQKDISQIIIFQKDGPNEEKSSTSDNDDSFYVYQKTRPEPVILDSFDIDVGQAMENYELEHGKMSKEVDDEILKKLPSSFVSRNFHCFAYYWELLYVMLTITSFLLLYHHLKFFIDKQVVDYCYSFVGFLMTGTIFFSGIISAKNFKNSQSFKNCEENFNFVLILSLLLVIVVLHFSQIPFSPEFQDFLSEHLTLKFLYYSLEALLVVILCLNFKMKECYCEYVRQIPVRYSLLPDENN